MIEIERKYLVSDDSFIAQATSVKPMAQGYLCLKRVTARIRICGDKGFITFKGKSRDGGLSRFEWEKSIPLRCARMLLSRCRGVVEKCRYIVPYEGYTWEVDLFEGQNEGLALAEVELPDVAVEPKLPDWIWREVTGDYHYHNSYLAQRPYREWFN